MSLDQNTGNINNSQLLIVDLMNKKYQVIHPGDPLRLAAEIYDKYNLDSLAVVDQDEILIAVLPKKKFIRAWFDGASLDDPCEPYIVRNPISLNWKFTYENEQTLMLRLQKSKVGNVPVVDDAGRVVGLAEKKEYLKESIGLISKSYALLESIYQTNNQGIITVDRNGCILRVNMSAENMLGISFKAILGMHVNKVFPEINYTAQRSFGRMCTLRSVPVIVTQLPIIQNDEPIGTNLILIDISDIETMAQELEMVKDLQTTLNGVLSASSDGVVVTDELGSVKFINDMTKQLVQNKDDKDSGHSIEEFLRASKLAQVAKTGHAEVDVCRINERNCIVSHIPIEAKDHKVRQPVGVVSTIYLDDNKITEEITRKWFLLQKQVQYYRDQAEQHVGGEKDSFSNIVSENQGFVQIKKEAQRIAKSTSTILLTGESGVGKDMFARAIHAASRRANGPFVKVNCVAIPETLFESELFGYAPGSFTGASKNGKTGYFQQAHGGTIFLDEIGDMPLSIQVKLLQVLQEKQFMRVGGTQIEKVDVRIIAATNRNLSEAIANEAFREDLYYRLSVIELSLPPLRDRTEDIIPLAEAFIEKCNDILGSSVTGISRRAREVLQQYLWPGNIRELENSIERAANYVWAGEIHIEHLPNRILQTAIDIKDSTPCAVGSDDINKDVLLEALSKTNGNRSEAAKLLKISRSTFYLKLARFGLIPEKPESKR